MVNKADVSWKYLVVVLGVGSSAVALGAVVQPMMATCGPLPADCEKYACVAGSWQPTGQIKADGTTCNDGNKCTTGDKCRAGICTGMQPAIDDGKACTADSINPTTCVISHAPLSNACCAAGVPITTNFCCSNGAPRTGTSCNDGTACTWGEKCSATGVCQGGTPITCTSDQCNTRACNGTSACTVTPLTGNSCTDGNACTRTDTCQAGTCIGSNSVVCTPSDQCHLAGTCNTADGTCSNPVQPIATPCGDTAHCGCTASGSCAFTSGRTLYCYDPAGNMTATFDAAAGNACVPFTCP